MAIMLEIELDSAVAIAVRSKALSALPRTHAVRAPVSGK
jgi:hypothetical protein